MAYERTTWNCGDEISAERMNNIEDGIEEALECCGGGGYECEETYTTVVDETVSSIDPAGYNGYYSGLTTLDNSVDATPNARIIYDGTAYDLVGIEDDGYMYYGATYNSIDNYYDFEACPFQILGTVYGEENWWRIVMETSGTHTVKIVTIGATISNISPCFSKAVKEVIGEAPYTCREELQTIFDGTVVTEWERNNYSSATFQPTNLADARETIRVFVNDTEYALTAMPTEGDSYRYGASYDYNTNTYDFSTYPFSLLWTAYGGNNYLMFVTPTSDTYSVFIEALMPTATNVSECFKSAVDSIVDSIVDSNPSAVYEVELDGDYAPDKTYAEIISALEDGKQVVAYWRYGTSVRRYQVSYWDASQICFSYLYVTSTSQIAGMSVYLSSNDTVTTHTLSI